MRASDCPTVDTTEFLLAALEQASEAVVIIDGDLHVSHFNAAAELIWASPAGIFLASRQAVSGLPTSDRVPRSPSGAPMAAGFGHPYRPRASRSAAAAVTWSLFATSPPRSNGASGSRF